MTVAGSATRPREYYMGTTGGGVFKTTDGGETWVPVTDKYFGGTIGAIGGERIEPGRRLRRHRRVRHSRQRLARRRHVQVDERRQDVELRRAQRLRGRSRACASTHAIPNIVYAAVLGHVWAPNSERGIYKIDRRRHALAAGSLPQRLHGRHRPRDGSVQPAACSTPRSGRRGARRGRSSSGGAGSGIFKITDGGEHWTEITRTTGLPHGIIGQHRARGVAGEAASGSGRSSRRTPAACFAPTTAARRGRARTTSASCASARGTTRASSPTRRTPIACTCSTCTPSARTMAARRSTRPSSTPARRQSRPVDRARTIRSG